MSKQKHVPGSFADEVMRELKADGESPGLRLKVQSLFTKLARTASGRQTANIQSAVALTREEKQGIEKKISHAVGAPVWADYSVNPNLLTGFRVSVGDFLIDASGIRILTDLSTGLLAQI